MANETDDTAPPGVHSAAVDVYVAFITVYTLLLCGGLLLLWEHRRSSAVRVRGFLITAFTVLSLHIYVAAIFIVYPVGSGYKCTTEFWYMNVLFPFGLALFQGANARLLAVSKLQQEVFVNNRWSEKKQPFSWTLNGFKKWYKQQDFAQKTYIWIAVVMTCQVILAFFLFFGSRRFSPRVGFFGKHVDSTTCRRGFEWLPSVVWQFCWTWILGPYYLFKTRKVRDTHHWALQTRLAIFSSLPGTPLWLAFLYTDHNSHLAKLNYYWPPATWFAPGLIVMQVSSILIPLLDARKHPSPKRAKSIASSYTSGSLSIVSEKSFASRNSSRRSKELAGSFEAFQHQIVHNAAPLARFAAEREFTGENVEFLCRVNAFKGKWAPKISFESSGNTAPSQKEVRNMYLDAARIYFELVDAAMSRTPINIDSKTYWALQALFGGLTYEPPADTHDAISENVVAPWDIQPCSTANRTDANAMPHDPFQDDDITGVSGNQDSSSQKHLISNHTTPVGARSLFAESVDTATEALPQVSRGRVVSSSLDRASERFHGSIQAPVKFDVHCFDQAEDSIKWLVYTNTWKSFLRAMDEETVGFLDRFCNVISFNRFHDEDVVKSEAVKNESVKKDTAKIKANIEMLVLGDPRKKSNARQARTHQIATDGSREQTPAEQRDATCAACRNKAAGHEGTHN